MNSSDVPAFSSTSNSVSLRFTRSPRERSHQPFWVRERPAVVSVQSNPRFATLPLVVAMISIRSNKMSRSAAYIRECAVLWAYRCKSQFSWLEYAGEYRCSGDRALIQWTFDFVVPVVYSLSVKINETNGSVCLRRWERVGCWCRFPARDVELPECCSRNPNKNKEKRCELQSLFLFYWFPRELQIGVFVNFVSNWRMFARLVRKIPVQRLVRCIHEEAAQEAAPKMFGVGRNNLWVMK